MSEESGGYRACDTYDVIYLAAGQGKRAKLGYPKQFARLGGKPIMVHALEVFQGMPEIGRVIVACADPIETAKIVGPYGITKTLYVKGGETRQESVCKALGYVETEYCLIHEAVRPFITADFVRQVISAHGDAATPWKPATSTVVNLDWVCLDRDRVGEVQMPQKYKTELLQQVHANALIRGIKGATDDSYLVMNTIIAITAELCLIPGLEENIKITTPLDLIIAEAIYNARYCDRE